MRTIWKQVFSHRNLNSSLLLIMFWWFRAESKSNQDGRRTWPREKSCSFVDIHEDANNIVVIYFCPLKTLFNANRLLNEFYGWHLLVSPVTAFFSHDHVNPSQDALLLRTLLFAGNPKGKAISHPRKKVSRKKPLSSHRKTLFFSIVLFHFSLLIERVDFFGILLCASIPNLLLDLAVMSWGYFSVYFRLFCFATVITKTFIEMTVHSLFLFIMVLFSDYHVELLIHWMKHVPSNTCSLQQPFQDWLRE